MSMKRILSDREALSRFKETHPDLGSARKIAQLDEEVFVAQYADDFDGDMHLARRVHKAATCVRDTPALVWANIKEALAARRYAGLFNNIEIPQLFLDHQENIPGYDRIFGNLDSIECEHYRSVFGPAAYFVDLMRFIEAHISKPHDIPDGLRLEHRRPDLFHIQLDEHNTSDLVPYIDLVNEVLEIIVENQVTPDDGAARRRTAYEALASEQFPNNLPFHLPLAEVRLYLEQVHTSLQELYRAFETAPNAQKTAIMREILALSPREYELITGEIGRPEALSHFYGLDVTLTGDRSLENVAVFLEQTGLTRTELNELVYQDLDRDEVHAGLSRLFFINNVADGLGPLAIEEIPRDLQARPTDGTPPDFYSVPEERLRNLSLRKLDRIYRFLKLARRLDWSFVELDWALRSLGEPFAPETVLRFDGVNDVVACRSVTNLNLSTFTLEAWVNPTRHNGNPILAQGRAREHRANGQNGTLPDFQADFLFGIPPNGCLSLVGPGGSAEGLTILPEGEFSHVAVTVDGTTVTFYVNGQADRPVTLDQPIASSGPDLDIGRNLNDYSFEGFLKDVRIWDMARTAGEIERHRYHRMTGLEDNLVGYWPLTEMRWNRLPDLTPNGNDGILGGTGFVTQPTWMARDLVLDPLPERVNERPGYTFNGVDQYLAVRGGSGLESTHLTLEMVVSLAEGTFQPLVTALRTETEPTVTTLLFQFAVENSRLTLRYLRAGQAQPEQVSDARTLATGDETHVAVAIHDNQIVFYVNGEGANAQTTAGPVPLGITDLELGRDGATRFFNGVLKEVRLWNSVRSADAIAFARHRAVDARTPGLQGYWRLDEPTEAVTDGKACDLSFNGNDLYLGGIPEDFMPARETIERLLPDLPIATRGTALYLDGDNDVIIISNPRNFGLGRYGQITLELWFRADDVRGDRRQVLFSQGDGEAGLSVYLANETLHVLTWCATYDMNEAGEVIFTNPREALLTTPSVTSDTWHHLAIVHDECSPAQGDACAALERIECRAYLDALPLVAADGSEAVESFRLSPVGTAYLGGVPQGGLTRFAGAYSAVNGEHLHFFAGHVTDIRLWRRVRSVDELAQGRFIAPAPSDDLVAYLPAVEGEGWMIDDPRTDLPNRYRGSLQQRNIQLLTEVSDAELMTISSHYTAPEALTWSNYIYTGRLRISDAGAAAGVTFLSRYPEGIDQYYSLQWDVGQRVFALVAHPLGVQRVQSADPASDRTRTAAVDVQPDTWYRFLVRVEDAGDRTLIQAKIWHQDAPEPTDFQIDAFDDAPDIRIRAGSVGVWSRGNSPGSRQFDNLRVWPIAISDPTPDALLLDLNFESIPPVPRPEFWQDVGDRLVPVGDTRLFRQIALPGESGRQVFGTDSTLDNIHTHYTPTDPAIDALALTNYTYRGRMRLSDPEGGIGITFLSRYPEGIDQYYSLRRDAAQPAFALVAHPLGVQRVQSADPASDRTRTAIEPTVDTWYHFLVTIEVSETRTHIRGKLWREGEPRPGEYQIDAYDESSIRIPSGTVGMWASGRGAKFFDQVQLLQGVLLLEDFQSYAAGEHPPDWQATDQNEQVDTTLFATFDQDGNIVYGSTVRDNDDFHTHYLPADNPEALNWSGYQYSGRMFVPERPGRIGVTFFSQNADGRNYYRLRLDRQRFRFQFSPHRNGTTIAAEEVQTDIPARANTWYRFLAEVEDTGTQTNMRAKAWEDGTPEPQDFQVTWSDSTPERFTSGTVGVWAIRRGPHIIDDVQVVQARRLGGRVNVADWTDTGARNRFERDDALFAIVDTQDNRLRWMTIDTYPLLLRPLNRTALRFDGAREYAAAPAFAALPTDQWTVEAWVAPEQTNSVQTLVSLHRAGQDETVLLLSINADGRLAARLQVLQSSEAGSPTEDGPLSTHTLASATAVPAGTFTHVALRVDGTTAALYINGTLDSETPLPGPVQNGALLLDVGRAPSGNYLAGRLKELRIWQVSRSAGQIAAGRYERPTGADLADLAGYWPFDAFRAESGYLTTADEVGRAPALRLGGLPGARWPARPEVAQAEPQYVLTFAQPGDVIRLEEASARLPQPRRSTVEVWFRVDDVHISHRKQVIFHAGNVRADETATDGGDQMPLAGLIIYVYDGALYLGGYALPPVASSVGGTTWQTFIATDRIASKRWHHAAIVLDGRPEVRPEKFQAYLDGKLVDIGDGAALTLPDTQIALGGASGPLRFHDEAVKDIGSLQAACLVGQVLGLRIWNSARTPQQIGSSYDYRPPVDSAGPLVWWEFDTITDGQIADRSGNGHTARLARPDQRQPLVLPPTGALPLVLLDDTTMAGLATIRELLDQHRLPLEQLTALWSALRHTGRADGAVLYDQVFNPMGLVAEPWEYAMEPLRWDVRGQEDPRRDRSIRSRLMGTLRVSSTDLDRLVAHLSGPDEAIVELDNRYLTRLYQRVGQARALSLDVPSFVRLLEIEGLAAITTPEHLRVLSERAAWLRRAGLSVAALDGLVNNVRSAEGAFTPDPTAIRNLADTLRSQSADFLVRANTFVSDDINEFQSTGLVEALEAAGFLRVVAHSASVTNTFTQPADLTDLPEGVRDEVAAILEQFRSTGMPLGIRSFVGPDISERLSRDIFVRLTRTGFLAPDNPSRAVTDLYTAPSDLAGLPDPLRAFTGQIGETLAQLRDDLAGAVRTSLADLLGVQADLLQAVIAYFQRSGGVDAPLSDPIQFFEWLLAIEEDTPIPTSLTNYLEQVHKILFLADTFELRPDETSSLLTHPDRFGLTDVFNPRIAGLEQLQLYRELRDAYNDARGDLLALLALPAADRESIIDQITRLTTVERQQIDALVEHFGPAGSYNRAVGLARLRPALDLLRTFGTDVRFLIELAGTTDLSFDFYRQQADALLSVLRSRYDDEQWPQVYQPIRDRLAEQRRDALLAFAMLQIGTNFDGRLSPDLLYEYLLLDVQVGSEVQTSRIVQAHASLQLYVQRGLMNLERGVRPESIPADQWEWMKNYRVWEANRKVFLYPESFIEPELRDTKTPLFVELERNLMQAEITQELAANAYTHYLQGFAELAGLRTVGSYLHTDDPASAGDARSEVLYLVGRTETDPRIYYIRERRKDANGTHWLPWERVDLGIESDFVTPVFAFGRLFLFWTEFIQIQRSVDRRLSVDLRRRFSLDTLFRTYQEPTPEHDLETLRRLRNTRVFNRSTIDDEFGRYAAIIRRHTRPILGNRLIFFRGSRARFLRETALHIREANQRLHARQAIAETLNPREVERLEERSLLIDEEGFFYDTRLEMRQQENVDRYNTNIKYSYRTVSGGWVPAQFYRELENELTEEQFRQAVWQRPYAQRVFDLAPETPTPPSAERQEEVVRVLQLERDTNLVAPIPTAFQTDSLTWSFWVRFTSLSPNGWPGSIRPPDDTEGQRIEIPRESLVHTTSLFDYDFDRLQVTATSVVSDIPGAQAREAAARSIVEGIRQASTLARRDDRFFEAENALNQVQIAEGSFARAAEVQRDVNAARTALAAVTTRLRAAQVAREQASNVEPDTPEHDRLLAEAARLDSEARGQVPQARAGISTAQATAEAALELEQDSPRFQSSAVRLSIQFADSPTRHDRELAYDVWQHIALILTRSDNTYTITLLVGSNNQPEAQTTFSANVPLLPEARSLVIGRPDPNTAETETFTTQMSEFRLWNEARSIGDIVARRNRRQTRSENLLYLPLNTPVPLATMNLVEVQDLQFTLPTEAGAFNGNIPGRLQNRERIILFYGDRTESLRNNLRDHGFTLTFTEQSGQPIRDVTFGYQLNSAGAREDVVYLSQTDGVRFRDFVTIDGEVFGGTPPLLPADPATNRNILLRGLLRNESSLADVNNQPGWYIIDTGDEQYLVEMVFLDSAGNRQVIPTIVERMSASYVNQRNTAGDPRANISVSFQPISNDPLAVGNQDARFVFERLNTYAVYQLIQNLFTGGIDSLLSLESQQASEFSLLPGQTPQDVDFWQVYDASETLIPRDLNHIPATIDFEGAYQVYYEEIFFHIPFLIANMLSASQNFGEAQRWYHYIFNPTVQATQDSALPTGAANDRYWRYLPFRSSRVQTLFDILNLENPNDPRPRAALAAYRNDPFDPHAIARLRISAYQKAVVMKYIRNLLDWGDTLFVQDNRESINEAMLLYILSFNLLGPRPQARAGRQFEEIGNYLAIRQSLFETPDFLTEFTLPENGSPVNVSIPLLHNGNIITTFCVPENAQFLGFWDQVEDRLFKIRHSLSIEGIFRQLALFQPPINPALLVQAFAAGGRDIGSVLSDLNVPVPHYRYAFMLDRAKEFIGTVKDLGAALLAALEKRDAEELALLQTTQERAILELTTLVREQALDQARENLAALEISKQRIQRQRDRFDGLIRNGLIPAEESELAFLTLAQTAQFVQRVLEAYAEYLQVLPEIKTGASGVGGSPVATFTIGKDQFWFAPKVAAKHFESITEVLRFAATISEKVGQYQRREEEWRFERDIADFDLQEVERQIEAAHIQVETQTRELLIHNRAIQHNQEIERFYRSKFTNQELYSWMISRLAALYFQAYRLAYDMAKSAEKAMQYELPSTDSFISFGHFDNLRRGLLAGESLLLELNRMERFHLQNDSRFLEIERTIPLSTLDEEELATLRRDGMCKFELTERLFNQDYPGHYFRVIKTIAISITFRNPLAPYQNINATLTQLSNRALLAPDAAAVRFLMTGQGDPPDSNTLRTNYRPNQQIAISRVDDTNGQPGPSTGMFVLNFFLDDRYFPFEGTGLVSEWQLEMLKASNPDVNNPNTSIVDSIEDVIIHLRYTAKFDQGQFRDQVRELL